MFSGQQQCANLLNLPVGPYLPPGLQQVGNIPHGVIPYIPLADLIVFKFHSCGLRSTPREAVRDARRQRDAELADATARSHPVAAECPEG